MTNNLNERIGKMIIFPHLLDYYHEIYYKIIKMQWQLLINLVNQIFLLQ